MSGLGLMKGLGRFHLGSKLNTPIKMIKNLLNELTDSSDTTWGDLNMEEIGVYADEINGEII